MGSFFVNLMFSLHSFKAKGVKPGDLVETPKGLANVIGLFSDAIWFMEVDSKEVYCMSVRACIQNSLVLMKKRLGFW